MESDVLRTEESKNTYRSKKKGPLIPEINFEWANMKFYAPSIAGGDQYEALKYYNKACALMEQNKNTKVWYYLFIKRQYAKACLKMNDAETAKKTYLELLEIEPNYKLAIKEFNTLKQ